MAKKHKTENEPAGTATAAAGHVLNTSLTPREARVLAGAGQNKKKSPPPAKR